MPKRAALYIRVSSDEQARHGLSLGEQRADLVNYAKEHGYIVMGIYADEGVTARKALSRRKELQRLLADVEQGLIDIIIIKCLDRWFRNIADFYKVKEKLDAHGVDWECTREQYNTTTPNGVLMLNLKLSIAQNESDQTGERIRYVMEGKKARREALGGKIPLGLKIVDKHLVRDEEKIPVVEFLFNYVSNGGSVRSSMAALWEKFGMSYTNQGITALLKHKGYIGEMYGVPDYVEPIIPHDLFARVQDILSRNSKQTVTGRIYLFSGLIKCPVCGRVLAGGRGRANSRGECKCYEYRCSGKSHSGTLGCTFTRAMYEPKIERYLLDNIQSMIQDHIIYLENRIAATVKDNPAARIETLKAKLSRLEDVYLDGMMDKEKYAKTYKEISQEISELSILMDRSVIVPNALREIADDADFRKTYENLTRENKKRFWKSIIQSITFEDTPATRGRGKIIPFHVEFL